jgi:hypothetical protein
VELRIALGRVLEKGAGLPVAFSAKQDSTEVPKDNNGSGTSANDNTSSLEGTPNDDQTSHTNTSFNVSKAQREQHRNHINPLSYHPTLSTHSGNPRATVSSLSSSPWREESRDGTYVEGEASHLSSQTPTDHTRSKKRRRVIAESEGPETAHNLYPVARPRLPVQNAGNRYASSASRAQPPKASTSRSSLLSALTSHNTPLQGPPSTVPLSPEKITQTKLVVRLPPSVGFVPLSLRSCATVSEFYTQVLAVWDIDESNPATVFVNFGWTEGEPMVMRKSEVVFEEFLRTIDEAPCWEEGTKCTVAVTIVVK